MELKFDEKAKPRLPTLREMLQPTLNNHGDEERPAHVTFIFDGYVYAAILGEAKNIELKVTTPSPHQAYPCLNLRSQTIRAIPLDRTVEPVETTVQVNHPKTNRYQWQ